MGRNDVVFTVGVTSATVAIKSQTTPLRKQNGFVNQEHHSEEESSPSHLFPKEASKVECTTAVMKEAEQSDEYDKK
jgi:hypothetical protein